MTDHTRPAPTAEQSASADSRFAGVADAMPPRWVRDVNTVMDLPAGQGRDRLAVIARQRRDKVAELRGRATSSATPVEQRQMFAAAARRADDSDGLVEQACDRLAEIAARGRPATGREQIAAETSRATGRGNHDDHASQ